MRYIILTNFLRTTHMLPWTVTTLLLVINVHVISTTWVSKALISAELKLKSRKFNIKPSNLNPPKAEKQYDGFIVVCILFYIFIQNIIVVPHVVSILEGKMLICSLDFSANFHFRTPILYQNHIFLSTYQFFSCIPKVDRFLRKHIDFSDNWGPDRPIWVFQGQIHLWFSNFVKHDS
jgi:hypothetical protein